MSIKDAILDTLLTSYWPLDDLAGPSCHSRYTEPEPELKLLLDKLRLQLPAQPPPKITAEAASPRPSV